MRTLVFDNVSASGTSLRGYLDGTPWAFEELVARVKALSGVEIIGGDDDKTSVEFTGVFDGHVFTLYDYKGDRTLHIGGRGGLDVDGLKAVLVAQLAKVAPAAYTARVPDEWGGWLHGFYTHEKGGDHA